MNDKGRIDRHVKRDGPQIKQLRRNLQDRDQLGCRDDRKGERALRVPVVAHPDSYRKRVRRRRRSSDEAVFVDFEHCPRLIERVSQCTTVFRIRRNDLILEKHANCGRLKGNLRNDGRRGSQLPDRPR